MTYIVANFTNKKICTKKHSRLIVIKFDPIGNRLQDTQYKYNYNELNQIMQALNIKTKQIKSFQYDDFGNLTKKGTTKYTYNINNRLIKVESPENTTTYKYDPLGQRIKSISLNKITNKTKTSHYLMSAMIEQARFVTTTTSANSATYTFHTLGLDMAGTLTSTGGVGAVLASSTVHKRLRDDLPLRFTSYQYLDGNGNVIATCNKIGDFKSEFIYTPFGSGVKPHGLITNSSSKPEIPCFGFSTKPTDETGLLYYGYRFYDAKLGRWLTRDPIGEKGGLNTYRFVNNNAIHNFDNLGLLSFGEGISWVLANFPLVKTWIASKTPVPGDNALYYADNGLTKKKCCEAGASVAILKCQTDIAVKAAAYKLQLEVGMVVQGYVDALIGLIGGGSGLLGFLPGWLAIPIAATDILWADYIQGKSIDNIYSAASKASKYYCQCPPKRGSPPP